MYNPRDQAKKSAGARRRKTVMALTRLAEIHKKLLWERAKQFGLSPIQVQVLLFVAYHPPDKTKVSFLAQEFFVSKASMSDTVKALLNKALVKKSTEPGDKRSYSLALTTEGKKLCRSLDDTGAEFLPAIEALPEAGQEPLYQNLLCILDNLQKNGTISGERICFSCSHFQNRAGKAHCALLKKDLSVAALRIDCPEHASA